MIGHQAVSQDVQEETVRGVGHRGEECIVVGRFMEDGGAAVAPVEDVVTQPADGSTRGPWHGTNLYPRRSVSDKKILYVPLFPLSPFSP